MANVMSLGLKAWHIYSLTRLDNKSATYPLKDLHLSSRHSLVDLTSRFCCPQEGKANVMSLIGKEWKTLSQAEKDQWKVKAAEKAAKA